jgi:16S rRNA (cytosine1402-N4)-methyltransferase
VSEYTHIPVLLAQTLALLAPEPGQIVVDGTVGLGGHSEQILSRIRPNGLLIGIDRDKQALGMAKRRLTDGFLPVHGNFFDIRAILAANGISAVHGILLDLGVSSFQLDEPERGFSYQNDAALDMRMDAEQAYSARHAVNELDESALARIIREYGEERWAARIAAFIARAREKAAIKTTGELVDIIKAAVPKAARRDGPHPAKRTFQALRIHVNSELDGLDAALEQAAQCLLPEGRLCVITFHSLEDRIVKQCFNRLQRPCVCPPQSPVCTCGKKPEYEVLTRKPVAPTPLEAEENPRARSAKLRALKRLSSNLQRG